MALLRCCPLLYRSSAFHPWPPQLDQSLLALHLLPAPCWLGGDSLADERKVGREGEEREGGEEERKEGEWKVRLVIIDMHKET